MTVQTNQTKPLFHNLKDNTNLHSFENLNCMIQTCIPSGAVFTVLLLWTVSELLHTFRSPLTNRTVPQKGQRNFNDPFFHQHLILMVMSTKTAALWGVRLCGLVEIQHFKETLVNSFLTTYHNIVFFTSSLLILSYDYTTMQFLQHSFNKILSDCQPHQVYHINSISVTVSIIMVLIPISKATD